MARSLEGTLDGFVSEISKSIKFFQTRYPSLAVGTVHLSGYANIIPGIGQYIASKTGTQTASANPWLNVSIPGNDQKLAAISSEMAVAVGLAQRGNK